MAPRVRIAAAAAVVCAALAASAAGARTALAPTIPPDTVQDLGATYGETAYLPTWLPPGYAFAGTAGVGTLDIDYTHKGKFLEWTVYTYEFPTTCGVNLATKKARYGARLVYYGKAKGKNNKNQSAWACFQTSATNVELSASDLGYVTAPQLMYMVGTAQVVPSS